MAVFSRAIFQVAEQVTVGNLVKIVNCPTRLKLRGLVSEETVVLRRWGSETRKFGLSTELINQIFVFRLKQVGKLQ